MNPASDLVFFHNPYSRASMVRALLEELNAPFELCVIDFRNDEQHSYEYLAINPMGKVPAIRHRGVVITESVAIFIHLADQFPEAGLAPALDDPMRGAYLRWLVFYAASFEPAISDRAAKRDPGSRMASPYGDFDTTLQTLHDALTTGPWLLGERFSAADVLWGSVLRYVTQFELIEPTPVMTDYMQRVLSRPAMARAQAANQALASEMGLTA